jgi:hypothetical protein
MDLEISAKFFKEIKKGKISPKPYPTAAPRADFFPPLSSKKISPPSSPYPFHARVFFFFLPAPAASSLPLQPRPAFLSPSRLLFPASSSLARPTTRLSHGTPLPWRACSWRPSPCSFPWPPCRAHLLAGAPSSFSPAPTSLSRHLPARSRPAEAPARPRVLPAPRCPGSCSLATPPHLAAPWVACPGFCSPRALAFALATAPLSL